MPDPHSEDHFSDDPVDSPVTSCPRAVKGKAGKKWDDACVQKILCKDSAWVIDALNQRASRVVRASGQWPDEVWNEKKKKWVVDPMGVGGQWDEETRTLTVQDDASCEAAALSIYHEATHTGQPATMSPRDTEYDAYEKTEAWAIARGLPPQDATYRTKDANGNVVPDKAAIRARVDGTYPGQPEGETEAARVGGVIVEVRYQPVDYDPKTKETILAAPGLRGLKKRPPKPGDRVSRDPVYTVPPTNVNTGAWKCPP